MDLSKSSWYYSRKSKVRYEDKYRYLKGSLFSIARAHPEYGYRRVCSELKDRGYLVNHKAVERLHSCWDLSVIRRIKAPKESFIRALLKEAGESINLVSSLHQIDNFEVFYTDFTEIIYHYGEKKAYLMPIIDHSSRYAAGHALGENADTQMALKAWKKARKTLQRFNVAIEGIIIHHDRDGVYTGHRWLHEVVIKDKVRISYSEKGAKGNVQMESFFGRLKEENRLLFFEQKDFKSLEKIVKNKIRYYNQYRKHSSLDNKSPLKYLKEKKQLADHDVSED